MAVLIRAIPPGWRDVVHGTLRASVSDRVALASAGCAFFATLALFPAMSMVISLYGLVSDPRLVESHIVWLRDLLPPSAYWLIADRLHHLVIQPPERLGVGLGISLLLTLWSSVIGMRSMLSALTLAYRWRRRRRFLQFLGVSWLMTLVAVFGSLLAIAVLVLIPALFHFVYPWAWRMRVMHLASVAVLFGFGIGCVALLYRFGPAPPRPARPWISPGVVLAVSLWFAASGLLTFYIDHIAPFGMTYGPLGAVVAVMLWFFVTAYAVLLGAQLNSQLEHRTPDATSGSAALLPQPA